MRSTRHKDEESFIVDEIKGAKLISKLIKKLKPRLLYFTFLRMVTIVNRYMAYYLFIQYIFKLLDNSFKQHLG